MLRWDDPPISGDQKRRMGDRLQGPANSVVAAANHKQARSIEPGAYANMVWPLLPPATAATAWRIWCSGTHVGAAASARRAEPASRLANERAVGAKKFFQEPVGGQRLEASAGRASHWMLAARCTSALLEPAQLGSAWLRRTELPMTCRPEACHVCGHRYRCLSPTNSPPWRQSPLLRRRQPPLCALQR